MREGENTNDRVQTHIAQIVVKTDGHCVWVTDTLSQTKCVF